MRFFMLSLFLLNLQCFAQELPVVKATDLISGQPLEHRWSDAKKGTVLVFLSSTCPCSHAHIGHLKDLATAHPDIRFLGVHSNANESVRESEKYFRDLKLPFPVIQDQASEWADRLRAHRTPHAFLISSRGQLLYQGGVTSSSHPEEADSFYLKVTLKRFLAGEKIESSKTRVLGCQIARH